VLEAGNIAPSFDLVDVRGGRVVTLDSLRERGPVLLVFVEADCPTSRLTLERLAAVSAAVEAAGTTLLAVHEDPVPVARETMNACGAGFAALSEPDPYTVSQAFGLRAVPSAFLIDRDGRVQWSLEGWSRAEWTTLLERLSVRGDPAWPPSPETKPGCGSKNTLSAELRATCPTDAGFDEIEDMFERGWTDGLPVVPPTRPRVRRMLGDYDASVSLGAVPPGMGELTLERLAACAVLAGCHPSYFPTVKAAAEAVLDPAFNVHGVTNTTHSCSPVLMINGPVRARIGINCGINCLGGWNRANATIGRAIRLMIGLTGRGRPGSLDRATMGQPGKISLCFGENEEASPWEPLSVTRGMPEGRSVVTVIAADGPTTVSDHYSRDPQQVLTTLALAGAAAFSPHFFPLAADTVFVLSPEHAATFAGAGWGKREVAARMVEASKRRAGDIRTGDQGPFTAMLDDEAMIAKWTSADEIVLVVAGGDAGRFSAVLAPWVGFGLGSSMTSRLIDEV